MLEKQNFFPWKLQAQALTNLLFAFRTIVCKTLLLPLQLMDALAEGFDLFPFLLALLVRVHVFAQVPDIDKAPNGGCGHGK